MPKSKPLKSGRDRVMVQLNRAGPLEAELNQFKRRGMRIKALALLGLAAEGAGLTCDVIAGEVRLVGNQAMPMLWGSSPTPDLGRRSPEPAHIELGAGAGLVFEF